MGNSKEEKKGHALGNAVVGAAGLALGYAALEIGLGGVLRPGREAIEQSLEPQEEVQAQHRIENLVNDDSKTHENQTHKHVQEEKLDQPLQHDAAASTELDKRQ
uniref:Uncharacterized protein n=1 Tax=Physcomitrium patens TaxID=3218 RepID=A0A2K1K2U7_PHYPA|nr:hypothetical protein PHYPA_012569 [Physcomitrium patens]